ncbi:MAG: RluA family pseudouridine synthase [Candidatus Binatia bacterium]
MVAGGGLRLDRLVANATGRGRRTVRRWIDNGLVRVNGRLAGAAETPGAGSEVLVSADESPGLEAGLNLTILHQDADWLVVAKPAGLHCERGKSPGSVAELLDARFGDLSRIGDRPEESGLVHRIDRDTSGVLLVARNRPAYLRLRTAFGRGEARKQYLALLAGRLGGGRDVDIPLARRAGRMIPAGAHDQATYVRTRFESLEAGDGWTLVLATMRTGAMHQVRVHAASIGHPLFGDVLYGGPLLAGSARSGQLLHALRVRVGGEIDVSVGPPSDFLAALAALRLGGP